MLYLKVQDEWLHLRFQLEGVPPNAGQNFEVTFVSLQSEPLFAAKATFSVEDEYRLEVELPAELAAEWKTLKARDWMPFRFMVRDETNGKEA